MVLYEKLDQYLFLLLENQILFLSLKYFVFYTKNLMFLSLGIRWNVDGLIILLKKQK